MKLATEKDGGRKEKGRGGGEERGGEEKNRDQDLSLGRIGKLRFSSVEFEADRHPEIGLPSASLRGKGHPFKISFP